MKPIIRFRNKTQVILFECELKGQISDGNWENARPDDHWKTPCAAECRVATADENFGPNFIPKRTYNFSDPDLLAIVGDRMIAYVKASIAFPDLPVEAVCRVDLSSQSIFTSDDEYWVRKRKEIEDILGMTLSEARAAIDKVGFTRSDLKKELDYMKQIYNNAARRF